MTEWDLTIATCHPLPEPDLDEEPLSHALHRARVSHRICAWDDPDVDWSKAQLTIPRSTWDYYREPEAFAAWMEYVDAVSTLHNSAKLMRWNMHKGYLGDLRERGVPVVPTVLVGKGSSITLAEICSARSWKRVVVKPAVGAASYLAQSATADALDEVPWSQRLAERDMLVQPFIESVNTYGERSLMVIDGELTHSVRKSPRLSGEDEHASEAQPIEPALADLARQAVSRIADEAPLYARVDMVLDDAGEPMISELELIEPTLFFPQDPAACERFANGVRRRLAAIAPWP